MISTFLSSFLGVLTSILAISSQAFHLRCQVRHMRKAQPQKAHSNRLSIKI